MAVGFTQQVREWAASKPADEAYDYTDNLNCALCQFLRENGYAKAPYARGDTWGQSKADSFANPIPQKLARSLVSMPNTFGALADRLSA